MNDQQKLYEVKSQMTFLQNYIQNHVALSFTDITFELETTIRDLLNVFEKDGEKYKNINFIKHNYPAIDLINEKKNIAIQVTTNADLRKVKKTIKTYENNKLLFSELKIIGFVKTTRSKLPNVTVCGIDYLLDLFKYGSNQQKDEFYEILKRKIPWNSLTPLDDKMCFDVVFDVINRSAVRDSTECEGSFERMIEGLSEVKEIITTGIIKGKPIRAKALVEYGDKIKRHLGEIEFLVSSIIQICNSNKNIRKSEYLCLSIDETDQIDKLKSEIIIKTNIIAENFGLNKKIVGSSGLRVRFKK